MDFQVKILIYIFFVIGILYFVQGKYNLFEISTKDETNILEESESLDEPSIEILNGESKKILVKVEVADTPQLRALGLSGRSLLGDYQGMLFVMDENEIHSFWMNDMLIPLDIIYIDIEGYIVDIFENELPCTSSFECESISSSFASKYVLEVNGGFVKENMIVVGNQVIFNISSEDIN